MKNKRNVLAALFITSSVFFLVLYTSCSRKSNTSVDKCQGVNCKNGGVCGMGTCSCPNGYEDADCGTASLTRYAGTWVMHDSVIASDHDSMLHKTGSYTITITGITGSAADFYITGISGVAGFQNLPCRMEDTLTRRFYPLQFRSQDQYGWATPSHMSIGYCIGVMNNAGNYIHGRYTKQYPIPVDTTVGNDTLSYIALRQ